MGITVWGLERVRKVKNYKKQNGGLVPVTLTGKGTRPALVGSTSGRSIGSVWVFDFVWGKMLGVQVSFGGHWLKLGTGKQERAGEMREGASGSGLGGLPG